MKCPLASEQKSALFEKFAVVVRAMVKGTILVAVTQGFLGGLIFWILGIHAPVLWGVVMAFLSLLPAVGAGLVWLPVALYLLATGAVLKGIVLLARVSWRDQVSNLPGYTWSGPTASAGVEWRF